MIFNDIILGKGITFPIQLDGNGKPVIDKDIILIRKSIITILTWPFGERYMLGEFGGKLQELLEDPNDQIMAGLVKHFIVEAITTWETRISALEAPVLVQEKDILNLTLAYTITAIAKPDSFIFPFYKKIKY